MYICCNEDHEISDQRNDNELLLKTNHMHNYVDKNKADISRYQHKVPPPCLIFILKTIQMKSVYVLSSLRI